MKKIIILLVTLCSGLLFAQTNVSTDITTSTTWTTAGSPYTITDNINVNIAATLTINPGVEVNFAVNKNLMVHGKLRAFGTAANKIRIIGAAAPNRNNRINFDGEIQISHVEVSNMNYAFNVSYSTPNLNPNGPFFSATQGYFFNNNFALSLYPPAPGTMQLDSCLFVANTYGAIRGSHCSIFDCIFQNNSAGIVDMWSSTISRCEFDRNAAGIICTPPIQITDCNIHDNESGINLSLSTTGANGVVSNLTGNELVDNSIGITTYRDTGSYNVQLLNISSNRICNDSLNINSQGFAAPVITPILELANNCWCQWDSTGVDTMIFNSAAGPITFMPIDSTCLPSLVFPGDANHDQIANNFDLLTVGQYYGTVGFPRASVSNAWVGQRAIDWPWVQSNGSNVKHADCDGDSLINLDDTLAINLNYGLTHNSWRGTAAGGNTSIRFTMPTTNIFPGDTIRIPIELGTFDTLAMGVYGIAFSINYDMMIVDSASSRVSYSNSWLGTKNTDMLTLHKDFPTLGQLDMALVRNNQQNRTGYGTIADLIVVINDDLTKRELPFVLEFSNIRAIDSAGQDIEVRSEAGAATIETDPILAIDHHFADDLKAYPNPIEDQLILAHGQFTFKSVNLVSVTGKQVRLWEGRQQQRLTLSMPTLTPGIYLLVVDMEEGRKTIKIELR